MYLGLDLRPGGRQVCGLVQQRLAAQPRRDVAGFADGRLGGFGIVQDQVLSVVEKAVSQVVGGAQLTQSVNCGGEGRGGRIATADRQAGVDLGAFGLHGRDVPDRARIENGEQFLDGIGIAQVVSGTGCHWPSPQ